MVSVTTILRSGPWGPGPPLHQQPKGKDWSEGPGRLGFRQGIRWGAGCGAGAGEGVPECLHSWESPPKRLCLAQHASSPVPVPGPELRMEGPCRGTDPPRAHGKVTVLAWRGSPQDSCQCLQPTSGSLELGEWDESVKHNCSPGGTKERRSQGPHSWPPRSTSRVPAATATDPGRGRGRFSPRPPGSPAGRSWDALRVLLSGWGSLLPSPA